MKKVFAAIVLALGVFTGALAQSWSSFNGVSSIVGVTVTPAMGPNTFTVSLASSGAHITYNGTDYAITQVFGVYALTGGGGTISATEGAGTPAGWSFDLKNNGGGGMAGWEGPSNNVRINAGQSKSFTFATLSGNTDQGFHLAFAGNTPFGQTAFIKANPVPEPTTMLGLAIGGLGLIARRRKNARS